MIFPIASAFILCCVCVLAYKRASRGRINHSIKWLIWLYSASFLFATSTGYYILQNNIDYTYQILIAVTLSYMLFCYAVALKRTVIINSYCAVTILAIINQIVMFNAYTELAGNAYTTAAITYSLAERFLAVIDIILLIGIAHGTNGCAPITSRQWYKNLSSFRSFKFNPQTLQPTPWAERAADRQRKAGNRST